MKISYDYSDMIEEIKELIDEEELELDETVCILRKYRIAEHFGKLINYNPIIDWSNDVDDIFGIEFACCVDRSYFCEKIKVRDFLAEMEEMNRII